VKQGSRRHCHKEKVKRAVGELPVHEKKAEEEEEKGFRVDGECERSLTVSQLAKEIMAQSREDSRKQNRKEGRVVGMDWRSGRFGTAAPRVERGAQQQIGCRFPCRLWGQRNEEIAWLALKNEKGGEQLRF